MQNNIIAYIRTYVPVIVGTIISFIVQAIPAVDEILSEISPDWQDATKGTATVIVIGLYYWIARQLGKKYPWTEKWLLGSEKQPVYSDPITEQEYEALRLHNEKLRNEE